MAGRDTVREWYLRQHTNSAPAVAAAKTDGNKGGEKKKVPEGPSDRNYARLSPIVLNGPLSSSLQLRRDGAHVGVDTVVQELLASNAKTASNIAGTIENRLLDRPYLLDNPATHGGATERAKDRAVRARSKRSARHFSMRQHRQAGSFNLPAEFLKYDLFRPMHEMWESYARSLVAECNDASLQPRLLAADLHGAILAVVESKSTSYVGAQGIMIRETDQTFGIITLQDKLRVVPKIFKELRFRVRKRRLICETSVTRDLRVESCDHCDKLSAMRGGSRRNTGNRSGGQFRGHHGATGDASMNQLTKPFRIQHLFLEVDGQVAPHDKARDEVVGRGFSGRPEVILSQEYMDATGETLPELPDAKPWRYDILGLSMQGTLVLANDIDAMKASCGREPRSTQQNPNG